MDPSPVKPETDTAAIPLVPTVDPTPFLATNHNHPPYDEMIFAAIAALKATKGCSKKGISDYIEQVYWDLPPNHSDLLTHHLKQLKGSGLLVMFKNMYKLPSAEGTAAQPQPGRRGRGRPRKKLALAIPNPDPRPVVLGLSEAVLAKMEDQRGAKRGRGRPFKKQNVANGTPPSQALALAPPVVNGLETPKRGRGRPPKVTVVPFAADLPDAHQLAKSELDAGDGRLGKLPVRRRGRPPGSGGSKNVSQGAAAAPQPPLENFEYEILQKKMETIQSRIRDAVGVLKAYFSGENPDGAMAAIVELEAIGSMDLRSPQTVDLNVPPI